MSLLQVILKQLAIFAAGLGVASIADTYVKPYIAPKEETVSPIKGVPVVKIVFWAVCTVAGVLLVKWIAKILNVRILK